MEREQSIDDFTSAIRTSDVEEDDVDDLVESNVCKENEEILEEIKDPEEGMEFNSMDDFMEYYMKYGNQKGFPVKRRSSEKGDNGEVKRLLLACSRSGFTVSTSKKVLSLRPTKKTGCKVNVRAILCPDGKWRLSTVNLNHNHDLSPGKSRLYKKNRIMRPYVQRRLELNDRAGIRPNKNFNSFVVEAGGHENVPFLQKDCYNYLDKVRRLRLGNGDAVALQCYFQKMQANNSNFFYLIDFDDDDDGRLKNVFWADARSRAAWEEFGDVVTFDTTYLTNKYDMPFAPFVGVNHHGQSILLGCGLISREDSDSFTWLFRSWLACMNNRAPTAIITDQDKAMKNAIETVFPKTRHRWCLWHIMKKIPEKLRGCNEYKSIKHAMKNAVHDSLTCEEFEERWSSFIEKFSLHKNEWLASLYNERSRWVPAFLKNTFWAGMLSTQRSESMNAFFDGYVNSKTSLKQFVEQYENALRSKAQKENEEDFNSFDHRIPCITAYPLEKQFQDAYTTAKFKEFQDEIKGKLYCTISSVKDESDCQVFDVIEDMFLWMTRRATFKVWFKEDECDIKCNCQLFEFRGILCRHALTVLLQKQVYTMPDKFILRRWRKDLKRSHTKVKIIYSDWTINPENERFDRMCNYFNEAADLAAGNDDKTNMIIHWIQGLINELKKDHGTHKSDLILPQVEHEIHPMTKGTKIRSPLAAQKKGRPRFKRLQSKTEQVIRKKKEKKKKEDEEGKRKMTNKKNEKKKAVENNICGFTPPHDYMEYGSHDRFINGSQDHFINGSQDYMAQDYVAHGSLDLNLQLPEASCHIAQDYDASIWSAARCDPKN